MRWSQPWLQHYLNAASAPGPRCNSEDLKKHCSCAYGAYSAVGKTGVKYKIITAGSQVDSALQAILTGPATELMLT